jgi:hypothetical protein
VLSCDALHDMPLLHASQTASQTAVQHADLQGSLPGQRSVAPRPSVLCAWGAGCGLPQMLKCEWRGGLPHAVQIAYGPRDSFDARVRQHAVQRQSRMQQAAASARGSILPADDMDAGARRHAEVELAQVE